MHSLHRQLLIVNFFLLLSLQLSSQVYLQLERFNKPSSLKFYEGDRLEYRLKEYPDTWKTNYIIDFKPEEQLVLFKETYYHIDDFSEIKLRYPTIKSIGNKMMMFSSAWYLYGGIATVASDGFTMSAGEVLIGGSFAAAGLLLKKLFYKRRVRLSKKKRLRVMDLRFNIGLN